DEAKARIVNNPNKIKIRGIRHEHVGKLVGIEGIVIKATEVYPKILTAVFECPYCGHIFSIEQTGEYKEPIECETESGGCGRKARKFKFLVDSSTFTNSQKVRLQEPLEDLQGGDVPHTIDIELESDITGIVTPGMRVIINGVLRSQQQKTAVLKKLTFTVFMEANSIEKQSDVFEEIKITTEDEQKIIELSKKPEIYQDQIKSIAPFIYGNEEIKEALLLQLFGGTQITRKDEHIRGDIHILLIGDPGVAKSKLILSQANLAPRGIYASGKTTSSAGLTACVVKDEFGDGRWSLEAGALVLADRGLACIDELDKMSKNDREALHEAMEQQTVSITKAVIAKLNSRCALLAAANPKSGHFDKYTAIADQINIPVTLLSRFDLIYTLMDIPQEEKDLATAKHIFKTRKKTEQIEPPISLDTLRKYIAYSRARPAPKMSNEAEHKLEQFYIGMRKQAYDTEAPIPITVRQLESLIRLSEARARARLSGTVTVEDAERVINLMTYCLKSVYIDPESGQMDVDWIVAGTTKTKRDRARTLKEIIIDLEKKHGDKVPITEIYEVATEEGIDQDKAEEIIEVMKRDGILFSRGMGVVGLVR
ncbi:MAG: minichromosome maintenance protein MCM, partial [Methanophagales archaeon]|nr:minichromosome maintenance protein MCM [Methanophagales archaeon]